MSATLQTQSTSPDINITKQQLNEWFDQRFDEQLQAKEDSKTPSMSIIATKGTMDWAYPPFILASTASALGWDVSTPMVTCPLHPMTFLR